MTTDNGILDNVRAAFLADDYGHDNARMMLLNRLVKGFNRGESSSWAWSQVCDYTDDNRERVTVLRDAMRIING